MLIFPLVPVSPVNLRPLRPGASNRSKRPKPAQVLAASYASCASTFFKLVKKNEWTFVWLCDVGTYEPRELKTGGRVGRVGRSRPTEPIGTNAGGGGLGKFDSWHWVGIGRNWTPWTQLAGRRRQHNSRPGAI